MNISILGHFLIPQQCMETLLKRCDTYYLGAYMDPMNQKKWCLNKNTFLQLSGKIASATSLSLLAAEPKASPKEETFFLQNMCWEKHLGYQERIQIF